MNKDRRKKFHIDLFNYDVIIVWSNDLVTNRRAIEHLITGEHLSCSDNFDGCHITNFMGTSWILLPHDPPSVISVHEISHCVDAIVEFCGINDGETRAHLAGYIASKIL